MKLENKLKLIGATGVIFTIGSIVMESYGIITQISKGIKDIGYLCIGGVIGADYILNKFKIKR